MTPKVKIGAQAASHKPAAFARKDPHPEVPFATEHDSIAEKFLFGASLIFAVVTLFIFAQLVP